MNPLLPDPATGDVIVPAPGSGPGNWTGAAHALAHDGAIWLAYRVRRPLGEGRGVTTVVARSRTGTDIETVAEIERDAFGAESFERPALAVLPGGGWRIYLSCATPGSKHWWVDSLTAESPERLPAGRRHLVHPGDETVGVKDPVVRATPDGWEMLLCCHPLTEPGHEDRMTTRRLTSGDGLTWTDHGTVLTPRPGTWDARGARAMAYLPDGSILYDGRPDAESNWHETTGIAHPRGDRFEADPRADLPLRSPHSDGAFRYATVVPLPDGRLRWYAEAARPDGAHDLVTGTLPPPPKRH